MKDWHLVIAILTIAGFGVILVTLHATIPQFRPVPRLVPDPEYGIEMTVSVVTSYGALHDHISASGYRSRVL